MRNRTRNRVFSTALAAAMVLGTLTGCGNGGNQMSDASSSADGTADSGAASEEGSSGSEAFSGGTEELQTVKILGVNQTNTTVDGKAISLSDWVDGTVESRVWEKLTDDLAQRGIKLELELIEPDQYDTVIQTKIAAGLDCDMVNISNVSQDIRRNMISQGTIVPVNDIWNNYSDGTAKEIYTNGDGAPVAKLNSMEDGNTYWLSSFTVGDYKGMKQGSFQGLNIRKDWLDKLGLEMPKTMDELYDVLVAFREQDANGNGEADELVSIGYYTFLNGIAQIYGLGNGTCFVDYQTGKATSPWYQEGIRDYITYMNKLYSNGYLEVSGQDTEKRLENKVGLLFDWWGAVWNNAGVAVADGDAACYYCAFLPEAGNGVKPLVTRQGGIQKMNLDFAVTKNADPEVIGRLLDYLSTEEYRILADYGIEGYSYQIEDGKILRMTVGEDASDELQIVSRYPALFVNNGIFPRIEIMDRETEIENNIATGYSMGYPETGYQESMDMWKLVYENPDDYEYVFTDTNLYLAMATEEEQERLSDISTDLETYSQEALTNLIFGDASLDELDSYIEQLKELGLDDMIAIMQARYDRGNGQ